MSTKKTNTHKRQFMWCDLCKSPNIKPGDEYVVLGGGNACQDCVPTEDSMTAKAGAFHG